MEGDIRALRPVRPKVRRRDSLMVAVRNGRRRRVV